MSTHRRPTVRARVPAGLLLLLLCAAVTGHAQPDVVSIEAFGIGPNQPHDAGPAVRKAVEYLRAHPGTTLVFPRGDYHFAPGDASAVELYLSNTDVVNPRRVAIDLHRLERVTLHGYGARLLFRDRIMPFAIRDSRQIELAGFEIDWPRPLMSQGTVIAANATGITLRIDPVEYPYVVEGGELFFVVEGQRRKPWDFMEFDPMLYAVAARTGDAGSLGRNWRGYRATAVSPGIVRLAHDFERLPRVGNVLVARHGSRDHAGVFIEASHAVTLSEMEFRHTSGLGVLAQYSSDLTFRNVHFRAAPGSARQFAGHDDGFHVSNCRGRVVVDRCSFFGLMDDPINVHGTSVSVTARKGTRSLACRYMHDQSVGLRFGDPGDEVAVLDRASMLPIARAKMTAIRRAGIREFEVDLDADLPAVPAGGLALENLTWTPEVVVRDSLFAGVRARGLLLTTPRAALVEGNTFRSSGAAVMISGDANGWYESGAVTDVVVRRNRFEDVNTSTYQFSNAVVTISPEIPRPAGPFHRNIRIEDNTFRVTDRPVLYAFSVKGLAFRNNRIDVSPRWDPWHPDASLTFRACEDVDVSGNAIDPAFRDRSVVIEGGSPDTVRIEGWR
jgi:hypothetical protein